MCEDAGVIPAYLPPYSPDLNPIEVAFAQLKQWIKRNRILATDCTSFEDFLRMGLEDIASNVKDHFRNCRLPRAGPRDDEDMDGDLLENEAEDLLLNINYY
jgi:transposase